MTNQLYTFEIIDGYRMNDGKINVYGGYTLC